MSTYNITWRCMRINESGKNVFERIPGPIPYEGFIPSVGDIVTFKSNRSFRVISRRFRYGEKHIEVVVNVHEAEPGMEVVQ